jgi:membrane-bound inhibitor of C-type lysozyme
MCATDHGRNDDMAPIRLLRRNAALGMRHMIVFSKRARLAAAVAILAFGNHAYATEAHYACSGGTKVTAQFSAPGAATGRVALTFENGSKITLPQVMSADGGRYANSDIEFWIKGRNATLTRGGNSETCSTR